MHTKLRFTALALAALGLAACGHKDKNAPLAFAPADTPYVVANLDTLDSDTRDALFAQTNAQLPAQIAQLESAAEQMQDTHPDLARLLEAFANELKGKNAQTFAKDIGLDVKGYSALYGLGLSPVLRFDLTDPKAFNGFVDRLEKAYGKPFATATLDGQTYRRQVTAEAGVELILATVGKQAVIALLPSNASTTLLRQAIGLDRPAKNMQGSDRLADLAKSHDYDGIAVGLVDFQRLLPLAASGRDPLVASVMTAQAQAESAKTGEPVANQTAIAPSCQTDATRIASRVPSMSFGYTRLDAKHQDMRFDVKLAPDISKAFANLTVDLPGLGANAQAPFDLALSLPVAQLRQFWSAQAQAVAAKPFACPALADLNESFAKLGQAAQKAAIPGVADLLGLHVALDSLDFRPDSSMPSVTGRLLIGSTNPAGLLAMGQMAVPLLATLRLTENGQPVALPANLTKMAGEPAWAAMNKRAIGIGFGAGEDAKLGAMLKQPGGEPGQLMRLNLDGSMYVKWVDAMQQKTSAMTAAAAALAGAASAGDKSADTGPSPAETAAAAARTKLQFDAMRAQARRIKSIQSSATMNQDGLQITTQTALN